MIRDIWESLGTRFLVFGLGAAGSILLTRALGPEGRGLYLGVASLVALGTQFGTLGMGSSNTYYLSSGREAGDALASNALVLSLGLGILLGGIGWFVATGIHGLRPGVGDAALAAGLFTIPASLLLVLGQNLLIAKGEVRAFNRIELARNLGWMLLVLVFAVAMGWGFRPLIWFNLATFTAAAFWIWQRLGRLGLRPRLRWDLGVFRRTVGYGLKAYAVTLFGFLVLRLDALLVQHWRGAVEGGQYGVAVQLGDLLLTVGSTVAMILFPKASELGPAAWPVVRRTAWLTGSALLAACLAGYALAPWAVRLLFGETFLPAAAAFRILLPGVWLLSMETLLVQYLNGLGMPQSILWGWVGALGLNLALNVRWIPSMGIQGAAWSSTLAYGFIALVVGALVAYDRHARREAAR